MNENSSLISSCFSHVQSFNTENWERAVEKFSFSSWLIFQYQSMVMYTVEEELDNATDLSFVIIMNFLNIIPDVSCAYNLLLRNNYNNVI